RRVCGLVFRYMPSITKLPPPTTISRTLATFSHFFSLLFKIHKRRRCYTLDGGIILPSISRRQGLIVTVFAILVIFAWSPWLTESFATTAVVENLGGPDQEYDYLGVMTPVGDIPKNIVRVPFGYLVYFPGEAMYIVTFWGSVF
ncbi:MAG: hypothetical protein RTU63_13095, partial [Candidatus Thorarchaeota archaeon]